jgi:nitrogen fixation-related uncharacterized protein
MDKKKLVLPISILLGCIILGGFYYASQVNKQSSTEKKQGSSTFLNEGQVGAKTPQVKKSTSGICHEEGSAYYNKTINFIPYNSIEECLASGGRLPKK